MPAQRSSSPSPSSLSSFSDSNRRPFSVGNPNFTFIDFIKLFNTNDSFLALQAALFEREDLTVKVNEMKYLATLVERLQDEANRQQEHIEEMFNSMEVNGLHNVLKKHFVRDNGIIRPRRGVEFNLPREYKKKYSLYRRRSSPYPPPRSKSISSSYSDDLPIGDYTTISRYPLDGGFIHHYTRPGREEASTSTILPKNEPSTINQPTRTITMDWITYQGGIGSRFNPIIIEDN